jgi:hypothetical protein
MFSITQREVATYTANEHIKRISISSARFEPAIPAIKWLQTYALNHMATGIEKSRIRSNGCVTEL